MSGACFGSTSSAGRVTDGLPVTPILRAMTYGPNTELHRTGTSKFDPIPTIQARAMPVIKFNYHELCYVDRFILQHER